MNKLIIILIAIGFFSCNSSKKSEELAKAELAKKELENELKLQQNDIDSLELANEAAVVPIQNSTTNNNNYSQTADTESEPEARKKMNNKTKGALIGAGSGIVAGAATGAAVSKKKGKGAVVGGLIGGAVGTGVGYGIGAKKDNEAAPIK